MEVAIEDEFCIMRRVSKEGLFRKRMAPSSGPARSAGRWDPVPNADCSEEAELGEASMNYRGRGLKHPLKLCRSRTLSASVEDTGERKPHPFHGQSDAYPSERTANPACGATSARGQQSPSPEVQSSSFFNLPSSLEMPVALGTHQQQLVKTLLTTACTSSLLYMKWCAVNSGLLTLLHPVIFNFIKGMFMSCMENLQAHGVSLAAGLEPAVAFLHLNNLMVAMGWRHDPSCWSLPRESCRKSSDTTNLDVLEMAPHLMQNRRVFPPGAAVNQGLATDQLFSKTSRAVGPCSSSQLERELQCLLQVGATPSYPAEQQTKAAQMAPLPDDAMCFGKTTPLEVWQEGPLDARGLAIPGGDAPPIIVEEAQPVCMARRAVSPDPELSLLCSTSELSDLGDEDDLEENCEGQGSINWQCGAQCKAVADMIFPLKGSPKCQRLTSGIKLRIWQEGGSIRAESLLMKGGRTGETCVGQEQNLKVDGMDLEGAPSLYLKDNMQSPLRDGDSPANRVGNPSYASRSVFDRCPSESPSFMCSSQILSDNVDVDNAVSSCDDLEAAAVLCSLAAGKRTRDVLEGPDHGRASGPCSGGQCVASTNVLDPEDLEYCNYLLVRGAQTQSKGCKDADSQPSSPPSHDLESESPWGSPHNIPRKRRSRTRRKRVDSVQKHVQAWTGRGLWGQRRVMSRGHAGECEEQAPCTRGVSGCGTGIGRKVGQKRPRVKITDPAGASSQDVHPSLECTLALLGGRSSHSPSPCSPMRSFHSRSTDTVCHGQVGRGEEAAARQGCGGVTNNSPNSAMSHLRRVIPPSFAEATKEQWLVSSDHL